MKRIAFVLVLFVFLSSFVNWHYNFDEAKQLAQKEHKYILLNFSGSDWCGSCIRMHKEIFASDGFQKFADTMLVMVNANFPRQKKNQLSEAQQKINDGLADTYNAKGSFPLTVLTNENGKVVKQWDGFPKGTIDDFILDISKAIDNDKHPQ
ncbi:thioredoxin family protein [Parasediminibacterium sp. JCM 36343]|uniref:thioredoxin family protein n=1 Tax=Parasediminibacterium sp. JCM 36343 TaxID=3374279 RepID=UPI00397BE331